MRLLALLFLAAPAFAQPPDRPLCIDASRPGNVNARPISRHEVLARNAIGDMRGVRIKTTCIHIDRAAMVGLSSSFHCLGKGDAVAVRVPGGPGETCRVTAIGTVAEDYARAEYKP